MTARTFLFRAASAGHFILCCGLLLLLPACQTAAHQPAGGAHHPPPRKKPALTVQDLEQKIHRLINRERTTRGLSPLKFDPALSTIARNHSKDMAERSFFSHESPEGHDFSFRYKQNGYACSVRTGDTIHLGAENIARNHLYKSVTTVNGVDHFDWNSEKQIAVSTVEGWMNSPGHRKNILTPYMQNEGIGIFIAPDDRVYITQNFC